MNEDLPLEEHMKKLEEISVEEALGIDVLRDVEAALDCFCSCHQRKFGEFANKGYTIGDTYHEPLHQGGATCKCQWTEEEREEKRKEFREVLNDIHKRQEESGLNAARQRDRETAEDLALANGFSEYKFLSSACPLQFEGTYKGDYVYFRERHERWRLQRDPEKPDQSEWPGTVIARGDEADIRPDEGWIEGEGDGPVTKAVKTALERLDAHERATGCTHIRATEDDVFCRDCGQRLHPLY